jgi:hypothetical protein
MSLSFLTPELLKTFLSPPGTAFEQQVLGLTEPRYLGCYKGELFFESR